MKSLLFIPITLVTFCGTAPAADWPMWRGPHRDDISYETGLLNEWPDGGPKKLWTSREAGIGYSGFAIVDGTLFTIGATDETEFLIALSTEDGSKQWQAPVGERLGNNWGDGPRSSPAVDGDLVVALGGKGSLICASTKDGSVKWSAELTELGGKVPSWGYSESPLIDDGKVLCTPGGDQGTVVAFDLTSGEKLWQTSDITDNAHYSSIVPVNHYGQQQYIQLTQNTLFGIAADDGRLLWQAEFPDGKTAVIPTPVYHDGLVYVTAGYSAGCMLIRVTPNNQVEKLYANKVMQNHHGGVVLVDGLIFGNSNPRGWVCQDFATGEMVWNEKSKLGKGPVTYADGMLYCLDEDTGECALVEATPDGWNEVSRFTLEPQTEQRADSGRIWTHPVISNGRLYLRDQEIITCHDVREWESNP